MQIIIPKWAYKIVELEDGTYLVIIDEAFLSSLRCPHCNEPLFKSGFFVVKENFHRTSNKNKFKGVRHL